MLLDWVLRGFLSDVPARLDELEERLAAGDVEAVHRIAHTIKGAAGNVGAVALQSIAARAEAAAKRRALEEVAVLVPFVRTCVEAFQATAAGAAAS